MRPHCTIGGLASLPTPDIMAFRRGPLSLEFKCKVEVIW